MNGAFDGNPAGLPGAGAGAGGGRAALPGAFGRLHADFTEWDVTLHDWSTHADVAPRGAARLTCWGMRDRAWAARGAWVGEAHLAGGVYEHVSSLPPY